MDHRLGRWVFSALAVLVALAARGPATAAERLPIFDTHVHYSEAAWAPYPPETVLKILHEAGVRRALVSSTPNDGTLRLYAAAPDRIVPELRPYRSRADMAGWFKSAEVLDYVTARLEQEKYVGIGEFHLMSAEDVQTPQMRVLGRLAVEQELMLHVHSGAAPVAALFALEPELHILWAHAGMSEPPEVVGALLDRHRNLWAELSFRAWDVAPHGRIDPAWAELLQRHADRFMIGSDTYVTERWAGYADIIAEHRAWLAQLGTETARAIAHGNAGRLFGAGPPGIWGETTN